eukprot:3479697-Ditylum_brightwellii.AAC.1
MGSISIHLPVIGHSAYDPLYGVIRRGGRGGPTSVVKCIQRFRGVSARLITWAALAGNFAVIKAWFEKLSKIGPALGYNEAR